VSNRSKAPENRQLGVIVALFWFSQYVYIPYQTPYLTALEVSAGFIGVIIGAYGITQMLLRIPAGLMADRSGSHKRFILLGQGAAVTANLTRIFFPGGIGFLAANLLSGLASALWISYMMMVIQGYPPQEKQRGTSRAILYNNIGILSGFVWGMVFYERWGMTFLCVSAVAAAGLGLMLALGLKDHPREGRVPPVR
jgi:predicted MFS family arabinose efflux permease